MLSFNMRAEDEQGNLHDFTLKDAPVRITTKTFVLLNRPMSPILYYNRIRRGDPDTGLFEGDIVEYNGTDWVVCYERGFYAINTDYESTSLNNIGHNVIKDYFKDGYPIHINLRTKHLFKYNDTIFRLCDIVGAYDSKLILRVLSEPIDPELIQQEVCVRQGNKRLYLGDVLENGDIVTTHNGRLNI